MKEQFKSDEFIESLLFANEFEQKILSFEKFQEREAPSVEDILLKDNEALNVIEAVAPSNYHYHQHISNICTCPKDYGGSGGNCAHYAANRDLWNIKAGEANISYHCPDNYAINAHQMFLHCANLENRWEFKKYENLSKKGLAFGWNKDGTRVVHVGVYAGWTGNYNTEFVYHYGFNSNKVIRNTARWWASNGSWGYHSFFERK